MEDTIVTVGVIIMFYFMFRSIRIHSRNEREETKICQNCGMKIPYNANVCPFCRCNPGSDWRAEGRLMKKSPEAKFMKFIFKMLFVVCIIIFILCIVYK